MEPQLIEIVPGPDIQLKQANRPVGRGCDHGDMANTRAIATGGNSAFDLDNPWPTDLWPSADLAFYRRDINRLQLEQGLALGSRRAYGTANVVLHCQNSPWWQLLTILSAGRIVMRHQTYLQGPTAHGGDYSIAFWRDQWGRPTTQAKAKQVVVVEYLSSGQEICRTQAGLGSYLVEELKW